MQECLYRPKDNAWTNWTAVGTDRISSIIAEMIKWSQSLVISKNKCMDTRHLDSSILMSALISGLFLMIVCLSSYFETPDFLMVIDL